MKKFKFLLLFVFLITSNCLSAREILYMGRSIKGLLLGDAYTTMATDEYALFYNPALLGREMDVKFSILNPSFSMTNALDEMDRFTNFPSSATGITERLMGFPILLNMGTFPYVKLGPFAISAIFNSTTSLNMRNTTHPSLRWDYRLDKGFVIGGAFSFGKGKTKSLWGPKLIRKKKRKKAANGDRLSFGFGLKHVQREGLAGDFDVFGSTLLGALNSGATSYADLRQALGFSKGSGWGLDLGVDYVKNWGNNQFAAGFSILDIGNTRFTRTQGTADIPVQDMYMNTGASFAQEFGAFNYTLSVDLHPLNLPIDTLRKLHIGLELALPVLTVYAGWNAGYLSYGTEIDLWITKLLVGFQGVEIGANYKQEENKRLIAYFSIFDFGYAP